MIPLVWFLISVFMFVLGYTLCYHRYGRLRRVVLLELITSVRMKSGREIHREYIRRTGMRFNASGFYADMQQLENEGFVKSSYGEVTPERAPFRPLMFQKIK